MQITVLAADALVKKYLHNKNNQIHSRESEVVLRALARELGVDVDEWDLAGLLHDLDWEQTENDFKRHGVRTAAILKEEAVETPASVLYAIAAHNEEYTGVKRESQLDFALAAGESVTGLIYAYALMRPEKLVGMAASSLNKKFKDPKFAAKVSREYISDIEKTGLDKAKFFAIAIAAMQAISAEIGF